MNGDRRTLNRGTHSHIKIEDVSEQYRQRLVKFVQGRDRIPREDVLRYFGVDTLPRIEMAGLRRAMMLLGFECKQGPKASIYFKRLV